MKITQAIFCRCWYVFKRSSVSGNAVVGVLTNNRRARDKKQFFAAVGMCLNEAAYPGTPLLVFSPTTGGQELKSSLNS
jgi:hypothetical protein